MPYRIHFAVEDLARTRLAGRPNAMLELSIAARQLQCRDQPVRLGAWRQQAWRRLRPEARMVLDLTPPRGVVPGFLLPSGQGGAPELIDRVRAVPSRTLRGDLERLAGHRPLPLWSHQLVDDPEAVRRLGDSLQHVYDVLLKPFWPRIAAASDADTVARTRLILDGGTEALFRALNPGAVRWRPPVLEVTMASGLDADLYLRGRGLLLVPSFFGVQAPIVDPDAVPQPLLTYPVGHAELASGVLFAETAPPPTGGLRSLAALLGRTRAAVLETVARRPGCSTTELATAVGIAPASASEHATTLRAAGLIQTLRDGRSTSHTATEVGQALLGNPLA